MNALLLLLLALVHPSASAAPKADPPPPPYNPPNKPESILLPTRAGAFKKPSKSSFGLFPADVTRCGKSTNTYNTVYKKQQSFELRIDCTPHPMRIVGSTQTPFPDKTAGPVDLASCIGAHTCGRKTVLLSVNDGKTGMVKLDAQSLDTYKDHKEMPDLCGDDASTQQLYTNEDECNVTAHEIVAIDGATKDQFIVPRWLDGKEVFQHRPGWIVNLMGEPPKSLPKWTNAFVTLPKKTPSHKFKSCKATCDQGQIVKVTVPPASWKMIVYLKASTDGFKFCFDAQYHDDDSQIPVCKQKGEMFVLLRQGVVVWPKTGRGSLLQMRTERLGDLDTVAVEIGYGIQDGKNVKGEFYVGNTFREIVASDTAGYKPSEASRVVFFFPSGTSLQPGGGISSQYITAAKAFVDATQAAKLEDEPVKNPQKGNAVDTAGEETDEDAPQNRQPIILSTTPPSARIGSNAAAGALLMATENSNEAVYVPGKWWTWGLFIGFVLGVLLGVSIIGAIFYVLRRTVYGFWYRGMYKRYGCDASGTTGGITGIGFGNTTTGAMTVGGTTGGTTAGTTAGTTGGTTGGTTSTGGMTTSGTTSGSTTKGSTSASTIAM